jgi:2-polyprenyl-6-hydroxyphenyl methylase/3-demethylubiquinone-9 3-methyltransferase
MTETRKAFDHSSDPRFLEYYSRASQSDATVARFSRIMDRALGLLRDEGREGGQFDVVDIGCGAGTQALLWAQAGHRVRALDINGPLVAVGLRRAEERGVSVQFTIGSATQLPFLDGSADVVLLPELLEHVEDWESCLSEAARVLRLGGVLYVSTSSRLCPKQQEFNLPLYSWYPRGLKRWCEQKAVTTHPQWANHAKYPAVHWFTYYELSDWFKSKGFQTLDRFDVLARRPLSVPARLLVKSLQKVSTLRFLGHVMTEGTTVWALRTKRA